MLLRGGLKSARRGGAPVAALSSRRGDVLVTQAQRSRMLNSAAQVILEHGYAQMSVARVTGRAGVSRRTFYDLFEDREDCFLAVFEEALELARRAMIAAGARERGWREQTRAALGALLALLDEEPTLRALLFLDALKAGPRVQQRRAEALKELTAALERGGVKLGTSRELPPLTAEGLVGAVASVIHNRLLTEDPGPMLELLSPLMGMIILPYRGPAAAQRELERPTPVVEPHVGLSQPERPVNPEPLNGLPIRITHRTLLVLTAIGEQPGASNRQVADHAGVSDQGQISKLLARLAGHGLIENTGEAQPSGEPNAWRLTARGEEVNQSSTMPPGWGSSREASQ
jgi:AcrR family transcriptional regulator